MSLLSPAEYPASIPDTTQVGGLFTLFLHAPLLAFSFISGISQISPDTWEQCAGLISQAEGKIAELMASAPLGMLACFQYPLTASFFFTI